MRTISHFTEQPESFEVISCGTKKTIFVRENIEPHIFTGPDEEERIDWTATEYTAIVSINFPVDETMANLIKESETVKESKAVREKRDALLESSDKLMLIDRIEQEDADYVAACKAYRQALRDIPEQEGFPWNIVWPELPNK